MKDTYLKQNIKSILNKYGWNENIDFKIIENTHRIYIITGKVERKSIQKTIASVSNVKKLSENIIYIDYLKTKTIESLEDAAIIYLSEKVGVSVESIQDWVLENRIDIVKSVIGLSKISDITIKAIGENVTNTIPAGVLSINEKKKPGAWNVVCPRCGKKMKSPAGYYVPADGTKCPVCGTKMKKDTKDSLLVTQFQNKINEFFRVNPVLWSFGEYTFCHSTHPEYNILKDIKENPILWDSYIDYLTKNNCFVKHNTKLDEFIILKIE